MRSTLVLAVTLVSGALSCKEQVASGGRLSQQRAANVASASSSAGPARAVLPLPRELEDVLQNCDTNSSRMWNECEAYQAYRKSRWFQGPDTENELIPLLADQRTMVRLLAIGALHDHECKDTCAYAIDRALSEQLLGYAEKEQDDRVLSNFTTPIARIDVKATGLAERVEALVNEKPKELALGILRDWIERNPSVFPRLLELAKSPEREIKRGALAGIGRATRGELHAEACAALADATLLPNVPLDTVAHYVIEGDRGALCTEAWTRFITNIETRLQANDDTQARSLLKSLFDLHARPEAAPAQKERIVALAKTVAESQTRPAPTRIAAIAFITKIEPEPLPYLRRFKSEPDAQVAEQARKLEASLMAAATNALPTEPRGAD